MEEKIQRRLTLPATLLPQIKARPQKLEVGTLKPSTRYEEATSRNKRSRHMINYDTTALNLRDLPEADNQNLPVFTESFRRSSLDNSVNMPPVIKFKREKRRSSLAELNTLQPSIPVPQIPTWAVGRRAGRAQLHGSLATTDSQRTPHLMSITDKKLDPASDYRKNKKRRLPALNLNQLRNSI